MNLFKSLFRALIGREKFTGRHLLLIGAVGVFFLIFSAWSVSYTSSSGFCLNCHEMDSFHQSWSLSSHKNVECIECHSLPGIEGVVKAKANGLNQLYVHLTRDEYNPKAPVNEINCLSCHQDKVSTNTEQTLARKSPHGIKHFENGMNCLTCHTGLVHDLKINTALPARDSCVTCHLDQMGK